MKSILAEIYFFLLDNTKMGTFVVGKGFPLKKMQRRYMPRPAIDRATELIDKGISYLAGFLTTDSTKKDPRRAAQIFLVRLRADIRQRNFIINPPDDTPNSWKEILDKAEAACPLGASDRRISGTALVGTALNLSPTDRHCSSTGYLALDAESVAILRYVVNSMKLCTIDDIEGGAVISRPTAVARTNELIEAELLERPKGPKGGAGATDKGREHLRQLDGKPSA